MFGVLYIVIGALPLPLCCWSCFQVTFVSFPDTSAPIDSRAGFSEFALAALWRFWVGIAVGLGVAKLGISLWYGGWIGRLCSGSHSRTLLPATIELPPISMCRGLGATGGRPPHRPPPVGMKAQIKAAAWSVVMWCVDKTEQLLVSYCGAVRKQSQTFFCFALLLVLQGQQQGSKASLLVPLPHLW